MGGDHGGGELERWVRTLLDDSPQAALGLDDGVVGYANRRAGELFGRETADLVGIGVEQLLPGGLPSGASDGPELPRCTGVHASGATIPLALDIVHLDGPTGGPWVIVIALDDSRLAALEEGVFRAEASFAALAALNEVVVRAEDEQSLLDQVCRVAVEARGGDYCAAWIGALESSGRIVPLASAGEPYDPGPALRALTVGRAVFMDDRDHRDLPAKARAAAALPFHRPGSVRAALVLYATEPQVFTRARRIQLTGLVSNVSIGLDRLDAARRLNEAMALREQLHRRLVLAQEEERQRIADDVHDDSVQTLAALDLRLGLLRRRVEALDPGLRTAVDEIRDLATSLSAGLRSLLFDLEMPPPGTSLEDVVTEAVAHVFEHTGVATSVELIGTEQPPYLDDDVRVQLVRIVKEALINVRRHADAQRVRVTIGAAGGGVEIAVIDDGRGIDPGSNASPAGHRGLATMRDRASMVGGWLRVEPADPGTAVRFWLPHSADGTEGPGALVPPH